MGTRPAIDWDATLNRAWLWDQGLGLAEAMDTAQRGMGVDWETAKELIERTMVLAKSALSQSKWRVGREPIIASLKTWTQLRPLQGAYETQLEAIEAAGELAILMASAPSPPII